MNRFIIVLTVVVLSFGLSTCDKDTPDPDRPIGTLPGQDYSWIIPQDQVLDGGPGKDGIPSVDAPVFAGASEISYLFDQDLVVGYLADGEPRAYPHRILDWHEIVNDESSSGIFSVIYCPLTGTATIWDRNIDGLETTFGVSGFLFNTNIIPYDRQSNSNWSQMRLECVQGYHRGKQVEIFPSVETTWGTWKAMYPDTKVITTETGFSRNYQTYPYGDYRTNDDRILFPVSHQDNQLPAKDRVLGVIGNEEVKVYPLSAFEATPGSVHLVEDEVGGEPIVVVGNRYENFVVAFSRVVNGDTLSFHATGGSPALILEDGDGNRYDVFGRMQGNGDDLTGTRSYIGYYFAWVTFYPDLTVWK